MTRFLGRLLGLCLSTVTVLAIASAAAAKTCNYRDACSKKPISAFPGGFLYDSCRRAYSVSASCKLSAVRVCRFKHPCSFTSNVPILWAPSGGVLDAGCGRWAVDAACKATVAKKCPQQGSPCNAYPLQGTVGQVLKRSADAPCRRRAYVMGPACEYNRVERECFFRDGCTKTMLFGLWPGAVYVKCGKLHLALPGCKELRL